MLPPGRVDVDRDVLFGILALEVQQLRHHEVRHLIVDRRAQEDDPLVEQPRVDVELALAARVRSMTMGISGMAAHPSARDATRGRVAAEFTAGPMSDRA